MDVNKEGNFRRTMSKVVISGVIAAVLLQGSVVFAAVNFSPSKQKPARLVEIDLKEGETLTYRVDQHIELHGSDGQEGESRLF